MAAPVRAMADTDAVSVAWLLRAAFRRPGPGMNGNADGLDLPLDAARIRTWRRAAAAAWVADLAGYGPVGALFTMVEPGAAWLAGLGVAPDFRKAGVGASLVNHALACLGARVRPVVGMETAPAAANAAALYARRGFQVADLTIRLRGQSLALAAPTGSADWREAACDAPELQSESIPPGAVSRVQSHPHSPDAFLVVGPGTVLLCDPDPLIPAPAGSLDIRLALAATPDAYVVEDFVRAAAQSALARKLGAVEIDLALADGGLLRRLTSLGLTPIATTVRLVNDPDAYVAWRRDNGPVGRWSF